MSSTLAEEQFEIAVFDHFHRYVSRMDPEAGHNRRPRSGGSRGVQDILTSYPPTEPFSPNLTKVIVGFKSVEYLLPDYSAQITRIVRHSPSQLRFNMFWTGEEAFHGWALDEALVASGTRTRQAIEAEYRDIVSHDWNPIRYNPNFADPWYGSVVYVTLQERATALGYVGASKQAEKEGQTALAKICQRLAAEESRHFSFYFGIAKLAMSFDPDRLTRVLITATEEFAMPGKYANLPDYTDWTRIAQDLGIVPDPLFAAPIVVKLSRGRTLDTKELQQNNHKLNCWNQYAIAFGDIFRSLGVQMSHRLRYLNPIILPNS